MLNLGVEPGKVEAETRQVPIRKRLPGLSGALFMSLTEGGTRARSRTMSGGKKKGVIREGR